MLFNSLLCCSICIFFPVLFYVWLICCVCLHCHQGATSKSIFCLAHDEIRAFFCEAKGLFVRGFHFLLPPSLSLPSEQSVSVATSHPSPLHPDWQMQCQTFWSRMHLPLLLQSPGQPSVNTSCTCQTAERVRARKSGGHGEGEGEDKSERGALRVDRGRGGTKMIKDSAEWTYSMYTSDRTGDVGEGVRGYSCFTWASGPRSEKSGRQQTAGARWGVYAATGQCELNLPIRSVFTFKVHFWYDCVNYCVIKRAWSQIVEFFTFWYLNKNGFFASSKLAQSPFKRLKTTNCLGSRSLPGNN